MLWAFGRLGTCRNYDLGPIPWRDIDDFAGRHEMPPPAFVAFERAVAELDHAYLTWCIAERERKATNARRDRDPPPEPAPG